jgi:predicted dehydrogenase
MSDPIHFGLIGCGRVAPRHAQSFAELADARLVAVADVIEARAQRFAKEHCAEAYADYRRLLERRDIGAVSICTPSGMHAAMAIEAMQAGKHVIVEKPMAMNLRDADRMIATAEATGVQLCVILQNRYNPPMQDLRRVVDEGKLGRLLLGNATVRWYRPQEYYEDGWHGTWAMDGGALMNQSIHHIDALQWLMGDVESVFAYTATLAHKMEAEDVGVVALRFKSGALGTIEGSTVTYPENLEGSVALFGERGSVKVGGTALNRKVIWKIEGELEHEREWLTRDQVDPPSVYGTSHKHVIADMLAAIRENRAPRTNGRAARKSVALVLAIYESARTGKPVQMGDGSWNAERRGGVTPPLQCSHENPPHLQRLLPRRRRD